MNWQSRLATVVTLSLGAIGLVGSGQAVTISNGTTQFVQPPRLEGVTATQKTIRFPGSTYYFTLNLPETAGEPLQKLVISPDDSADRADFDLGKTEAFEGTLDREGTKLPLQTVTQDPKTRAITITFAPAITPEKRITVGLYANHNPDGSGTYLYGVTAFPPGEQASGQFLGYGRIQIYGDQTSFLLR